MSGVYKAVCEKLLLQKDTKDLCCMCLALVDDHGVSVNDEVMIYPEDTTDDDLELMSSVLIYVLGEQVTPSMSLFASVCKQCATSAIESYKFIKKSRETAENLISATDDLGNCFENVSNETDYQSLFVSIHPKDKTIQQFYDAKKQPNPKETALLRFHFIAFGRYEPGNKKKSSRRPRDFSTIFIKTHELVHDPSKPKEYKCKVCLRLFPTSGNLRQHFFSVHFKKEFACTECPKSFGTAGLLQSHISISHFSVECSECGKRLLNRTSSLKRHAQTHESRLHKVCYRCGRVYKKVTDYNRHIAQNTCEMPSRIPGDYTCDTCGYHCNFKHQLINHIKYEHAGAKGHVCQWCNRKCYSASALRTHILKHTKEKNFICSMCGGKFVTKQSLLNHTRLHTGEKPYPCSQCDQSFISASRRNDHIERYHVNVTFDCDLCEAKYSAKRSLVKHRKRHFVGDQNIN